MSTAPLESSSPSGGLLSITAERRGEVLVLTVGGEIDLASASELEAALCSAEAADAKLVMLDLAGVEFMDSTGLHVLLRASEFLGRNGRELALSRLTPQVHRLFELTGTLREFAVDGLPDPSATRRLHGDAA